MIAEEGKAGESLAKGGPPFWYPCSPPLTILSDYAKAMTAQDVEHRLQELEVARLSHEDDCAIVEKLTTSARRFIPNARSARVGCGPAKTRLLQPSAATATPGSLRVAGDQP
jgi:hypothetical protein